MPMRGAVYVNGKITQAEEAVIPVVRSWVPVRRRDLRTLRIYNLVPFLYERHVRRLRVSADHLSSTSR